MSQTELQRFAAAVQAKPELLDSCKGASTPTELGAWLRAEGYDVADGEVAEAAERGRDLSDEQLNQITGGGLGMLLVGLAGSLAAAGALVGGIVMAATAGRGGNAGNGARRIETGGL